MHAAMRSALFGSALPYAGWDLALGFRDSWYRSGGLVTRDPAAMPGYAFVRAGAKWEDAGAGLVPIETGRPALVPGMGFLARPAYTNAINNSSFAGAVAGNPGTTPPGTGLTVGSLGNGLTRQIVGIGTDPATGLSYIDYRIFGTANAAIITYPMLSHSGGSAPAPTAAPGDMWTGAVNLDVLPGASLGTTRITLTIDSRSDDGSAIGASFATAIFDNGVRQPVPLRIVRAIGPLPASNSARVYMFVSVALRAGETVDFTMRLSAPSLVRSAVVGPYVPTSNGPVTLPQDDMRFAMPAVPDDDWVVMAAVSFAGSPTSLERPVVINDGTSANRVMLSRSAAGALTGEVVVAGGFLNMPATGVSLATASRAALLVRRRAGRYSVAVRTAAGTTLSGDSALQAAPVGLSQVSPIANGATYNGASPMNGAAEFIGYRRGPATDDQVRAMLAAVSV